MNETFTVAVDGGGTGTRVRAYLPNRSVLGVGNSGPSSLTLGVEMAWKNIHLAINDATANTPFAGQLPQRIVAGLAGSRNPKQQQAFFQHIDAVVPTDNIPEITIISDAYTSAIGALSGQPSIVIAIGTGLGACAVTADFCTHYISGWGFRVGDEGAGSWMGLQAVKAYIKHFDGRETRDSDIYEVIAQALGTTVSDIQHWCLYATATDFARFAKPIVTLAESGDALALDIMKKAADEVLQVIEAYDRCDKFDPGTPVVLLGSLGQIIQHYLPDSAQKRLHSPKGDALDGASAILWGACPKENNT